MISDILTKRIYMSITQHSKRPDKLGLTLGQFQALISEFEFATMTETTKSKSNRFMGIPIEIVEVEKELGG